MASPIIRGTIPAGPFTFAPGETKQVRIDAYDPDNGPPVSFQFSVADTAGNKVPLSISAQVADSLTFSASPAPSGWSVAQDAADPALFRITAP